MDIRERDLDCYIRFWEYSCGRGNFPDWSIIIVQMCIRDRIDTGHSAAFRKWLISKVVHKQNCNILLYFSEGMNSILPVSYTHLDVYKRQLQTIVLIGATMQPIKNESDKSA